jgi:hypothetical protein
VPIKQIKDSGFNLDIKNPNAVEEGVGDIQTLLPQHARLSEALEATRRELFLRLEAALKGGSD